MVSRAFCEERRKVLGNLMGIKPKLPDLKLLLGVRVDSSLLNKNGRRDSEEAAVSCRSWFRS